MSFYRFLYFQWAIMEFDVNLSKLQGALYSLGTQNLLNEPESLHVVVSAIKEIIKNLSDDSKSKLTFFMVLNTELSIMEKLKDDENLGLFTGIIPLINESFLIAYAYGSNLQSYLFKVIENCPAPLGLELLNIILRYYNFHVKEDDVEHLYQLWRSVFVKICKIYAGLSSDSYKKFIIHFQDLYSLIRMDIIHSMERGNVNLIGSHLYYFFKTVLNCVRLHKSPNVPDDPIYKMSIQIECEKSVVENTDCISLIFKDIFQILQNFSIDMWMSLSDSYLDSDLKNSLQSLIGNVVHTLLKEVAEFNLPSDVLDCLSNLAINHSDVMAKASIDEVIVKVENGDKEWFGALVRHSAFIEKKSMECISEYLHLANKDDLNVILGTTFELISNSEIESLDLSKKLFLKALKATDWSYWVEKVFEEYRPNLLTTPQTHIEIVETFNKMSKEKNIPDGDLISLCLQSPQETIKKVCDIAICSSQQTEFSVDLLKLLKRPCNASYSDELTLLDHVLLGFLLEESTHKAKQSFVDFVVHLKKENLLGPLFLNNLLKKLRECLEEGTLDSAVLSLKVTEGLLNSNLFQIDKAEFLVFMCQVLGYFSWNLTSFSVVKADGRELVGRLVDSVMSELDDVNEVKFQWARQEILKSWEVNQAHFCDLWFSSGLVWFGSGKFHSCILTLIHSHLKVDDSRNYLLSFDEPFDLIASTILSLVLLLPVVTFREWNSIFDNLTIVWKNMNSERSDIEVHYDVLDMFGSSLHLLTLHSNEKEEAHPCHEYCVRNFARLAKQYYAKISGNSLLKIFEKIFVMLGTIENKSRRKFCWEIFSPFLLDSVDCMKKKNVFETNRNLITKLLPLSDSKDVTEAIEKRLQ